MAKQPRQHFNKRAMTHIALHVHDIDESLAFYKDWGGMDVVHQRPAGKGKEAKSIYWLASPGYEDTFVLVLVPGGPKRDKTPRPSEKGYSMSHIGIAVETREELMELLDRARKENKVFWDLFEYPFPVGSLFGIEDPDGNIVEFSVGQPLGKDFKAKNDNKKNDNKKNDGNRNKNNKGLSGTKPGLK